MLFGGAQRTKSAAEDALKEGDLERAAAQFEKVLKKTPDDLQVHKRLADLYQQTNQIPLAVQHYEVVATTYASQGLMLRAISACRSILELAPDNVAAHRTLDALEKRRTQTDAFEQAKQEGRATMLDDDAEEIDVADVIGGDGPTIAADEFDAEELVEETDLAAPLTEEIDPDMVMVGLDSEVDLDAMIEDDSDLVVGETDVARGVFTPSEESLTVPALFAEVPKDAFFDLVRGLQMWEVPAGGRVIQQGEFGTSCFLIASGSVRVERDGVDGGDAEVLCTLGDGDVFGEIALLARNQRTANVIAEEPTEVLEIERAFLEELIEKYPSVRDALVKFSRDRMLQNLMRTAPLFRDLSRGEKKAALARFAPVDVRMGENLLVEGEPGTGLYVLLTGEVEVAKENDAGAMETVRSLHEGDVFGEMSLLFDEPANATITVLRNAHVLRLSPEEFADFSSQSPNLRQRLQTLGTERANYNAEMFEAARRTGPDHI